MKINWKNTTHFSQSEPFFQLVYKTPQIDHYQKFKHEQFASLMVSGTPILAILIFILFLYTITSQYLKRKPYINKIKFIALYPYMFNLHTSLIALYYNYKNNYMWVQREKLKNNLWFESFLIITWIKMLLSRESYSVTTLTLILN